MTRALTTLSCLLALAFATASEAASPPKGRYDCSWYTDGRTYGYVQIVSGKKYKWNGTQTGRYSTSGKKITWKKGPLEGVYKRTDWRRSGGMVYMNLYDGHEFGRTMYDVRCIRRPS